MPWLEAAAPARMERVALVAPAASLREVLVEVADAGAVEIDQSGWDAATPSPSARLLRAAGQERQTPALSAATPVSIRFHNKGRAH